MTASPSASVAPSGRPRTARTWFSNWLVTAPSIVQWPGVVDARRELVREELPVDVEELDGEHADVAERVEERARDLLRLVLRCVVAQAPATRRGSRRDARSRRADRRPSRRHDLSPPGSRARDRTERSPPPARSRRASSRRLDDPLTLAVVAETTRLHERRNAGVVQRAEASRRDAEPPEELLLDEAILSLLERARIGDGTHATRRLDRDVLELVRDRVGAVGEAVEERLVVVRPDEELADVSRAGVGGGVEKAKSHPERRTRRARACARADRPRCSR